MRIFPGLSENFPLGILLSCTKKRQRSHQRCLVGDSSNSNYFSSAHHCHLLPRVDRKKFVNLCTSMPRYRRPFYGHLVSRRHNSVAGLGDDQLGNVLMGFLSVCWSQSTPFDLLNHDHYQWQWANEVKKRLKRKCALVKMVKSFTLPSCFCK